MIDSLRVDPGTRPEIASRDPRDTLGLESKDAAKEQLSKRVEGLTIA